MRTSLVRLGAALGACLLAAPAPAHDDDRLEEWRWVRFGVDDGLPDDLVTDVVESASGVPWVGTPNGAAWYDGFRWQPVGPEQGLPCEAVQGLVRAAGDEVCVAFRTRVHVGSASGFRLVADTSRDGRLVGSVGVEPSGHVLLVTSRADRRECSLERLAPEGATPLELPSGCDPRVGCVLTQLESGRIMLAAPDGLHAWDGHAWTVLFPRARGAASRGWFAENVHGDGLAAFAHPPELRGLWHWSRGRPPSRLSGESGDLVDRVLLAPNGDVLTLHDSSHLRVRLDGRWASHQPPPVPLRTATATWYRTSGDLWVATSDGLYLLRSSLSRWERHPGGAPESGLNRVHALAEGPDGEIVAATAGGVQALVTGASSRPPSALPPDALHPTAVGFDSLGRLWAGSGGAFTGARVWNGDAWETRERADDGTPIGLLHAMSRDHGGRLYLLQLAASFDAPFLSSGDVFVVEDGRVQRWGPAAGLDGARVYSMSAAADGTLWFGASSGLHRYRNGAWRRWTLPEAELQFCVAADGEGGAWSGHHGGGGRLVHVDGAGRVESFDLPGKLGRSGIWGLLLDRGSRLWVATPSGVGCRWPDGTWGWLKVESGLLHPMAWPLLEARERIWIGTRGGGTYALPVAALQTPPPQVRIARAEAWERSIAVEWTVHPFWGENWREKPESRWRLDGGPWSEWSTAGSVLADDLAEGEHAVEIQSKNLLGAASEPVRAAVRVAPPVWRSGPFVVGMQALVLGVVVLGSVLVARKRRDERRLREAQESARDSERRLARVLEDLPDGFLSVDAVGRVTWTNAVARDLLRKLGVAEREVVGGDLAELLDIVLTPELKARLATARRERRAVEHEVYIGPLRTWHVLRALPSGDGLDVILQDVTARRRLEEERLAFERKIADTQRFESLGVLAGGVAHDFNNLLLAIMGHAEAASSALPSGHSAASSLGHVITASSRAAELTQQLLDHAGRSPLRREPLDLNRLVTEMGDLVRTAIPRGASLDLDLGPQLPAVEADAGRMRQVVLNLIVNAAEALSEGRGRVAVRTAVRVRDGGVRVTLEVQDDGVGMDPPTLARIFEPFFTTKASGRGLGLAAVRGIVESHGGGVEVESEPGRGTCFRVVLPPSERAAPVALPPPREAPGRAEGVVLVVDDEELVRRATCALLASAGHATLQAGRGEEAVRLFHDRAHEIVAAVLDVTMPGLGGPELARRLRRVRADLPVVLVSGWAQDEAMEQAADVVGAVFLQKPFTASALASALRRASPPRAATAG